VFRFIQFPDTLTLMRDNAGADASDTIPSEGCLKAALFFDRDGTLIEERDYLSRPAQVRLFPGAAEALRRAQDNGLILVMVTNQSGVGRGYFKLEDVQRVHAHLAGELAKTGVKISKIYIAPEAPDQPSRGRKPSPQFLFDARDEIGIALNRSFMVGDKLIDLECGWNAGVRQCLLVRTGYGAETEKGFRDNSKAAVVVDNLDGAVEWILKYGLPHKKVANL
jgi:D-glycero-D-manno-heptose 1,7-bisphosphate phosphatase